jgi:excisionase family DNA binding protein
MRVNRKTLYEALNAGEVPGVIRVGRTVRLCRDAVLEWVRGDSRDARSSRRT